MSDLPDRVEESDEYERWSLVAYVVVWCLIGAAAIVGVAMALRHTCC